MTYVFVGILLFFMIVAMLLQLIALPGNWFMILLLVIWKFIGPVSSVMGLTWTYLFFLIALAALGEVMEWFAQLHFGKKYGSSSRGNIGGIIGAIVGAIVMLPFFFGFGAILGALAGAYLGCLVVELFQGRTGKEARHAAWGALMGRFMGSTFKLGMGITIIWLAMGRIWPKPAAELLGLVI